MGCRTRVIGNVYDPTREVCNRRGNLSFTSINLPRIAIESKGDVELFFKTLDERMDLVFEQLDERFEIQARKKVRNYPFLMGEHVWMDSEKLGWDDEVREVLKHGTLSIGFIGLAECLKALTGAHHGESAEAQALGLEMDAIASSVIGGTLLTGGVGNVIGSFFGVLINGTISTLVKTNGKLLSSWSNIAVAALLCFFIVLQSIFAKIKEKSK